MELFDLAAVASAVDNAMDDSYRTALIDAQIWIDKHSCNMHEAVENPPRLRILPTCRLFEALSSQMQAFFANDILTNLYLTETLVALVTCVRLDVHGWLLTSSADTGSVQLAHHNIVAIIKQLMEQVSQWRSQFGDWDTLFALRRQQLNEEQRPSLLETPHNTGWPEPSTPGAWPDVPPSPTRTMSTSGPTTPRGRNIAKRDKSMNVNITGSPTQSGSFSSRPLAASPLKHTYFPAEVLQSQPGSVPDVDDVSVKEMLKTQVTLPPPPPTPKNNRASISFPSITGKIRNDQKPSRLGENADEDNIGSGTITPLAEHETTARTTVTLNHLLTNTIILQEFILEIAAVIQVRAALFSDVDIA